MQTYRIYLVRHGLTQANEVGAYIGQTDLPLSAAGLKALQQLKNSGESLSVEKVYTSPLLRARQTAAVLFPDFHAEEMPELTEFDFGEFEGKTAAQLENNPDFAAFVSGRLSAPPGGEDQRAFAERICLGYRHMVENMMDCGIHTAAAVLHGGVIMTLLSCSAMPRRKSVEWTCAPGHGFETLVTPSLYQRSGVIEVTASF